MSDMSRNSSQIDFLTTTTERCFRLYSVVAPFNYRLNVCFNILYSLKDEPKTYLGKKKTYY